MGVPENLLSQHLSPRGSIKDDLFDRLLEAMQCPPAAVSIVTACLEALEALEQIGGLTEAEWTEIEETVLGAARLIREGLIEAVRLSRSGRAESYPEASSLVPARLRAEELFERLKGLDQATRLAVVQVAEEFQTWSLCEKYCEASIREASRDLKRAADFAHLAQEIAALVPGEPGWRHRIQGYAAGHGANVLKAVGELNAADAALEEAKRLWQAGTDPAGILDPGRLLHFEAALRRDQRRFDEALARLDEAGALSHPERALVSKGFTYEVMGEYERAIESLLQAAPLVDRMADPRQRNILRLNLANCFVNVARFAEAEDLLPEARQLALELGDDIDLIRLKWLEGRIAAGLGRPREARRLLEEARREFGARRMSYDVALALLEEAVLLLAEGRVAEVKELAEELTKVFESKGVHREALAALRLFRDAAEREAATAELARCVLRFLFRARHDQGLRFTES